MDNRLDPPLFGGPIRPTALPVDGLAGQARTTLRGVSALPRAPPVHISTTPGPSPPKRARKDRGPNWLPQEIAALIAAKREMFLQELDTVDGRDLMNHDYSKWIRVSHYVNGAGFSPILRDGPACKTKWNQIIPDYKRIADYLSRTGRNIPDYWDLSPAERKAEGLPRVFAQEVYDSIHEWYGNRPIIQPPHVRDMLAPNDGNYRPPASQAQQDYDGESKPDNEDPMDFPAPEHLHGTDDSTPPPSPPRTSSTPSRTTAASEPAGTPNARPYTGLPPGVTPQYISSSETSHFAVPRRPGNTVVKRKTPFGHAVIAEATKATGVVMAQQMQEIANASRELERSKIEVQLKLFSEEMAYQREKDRRQYENQAIANDNARLSILKQGEMVTCLSHLSTVLSNSLSMNREFVFQGMPHYASPNPSTSPKAFYDAGTSGKPAHMPGQLNPNRSDTGHLNNHGGQANNISAFHPDHANYPSTRHVNYQSSPTVTTTNLEDHDNNVPVTTAGPSFQPTTSTPTANITDDCAEDVGAATVDPTATCM